MVSWDIWVNKIRHNRIETRVLLRFGVKSSLTVIYMLNFYTIE